MATPTPATDPNVVLPKAVRAAAKRADEFFAPPEPPKTPENPPKDAQIEPPAPEPEKPVAAAEPPPAPEPAPEPAPPPPPKPTVDYEHLYRSWKGRYDAEVPRMRQQIAALEEVVRAKPQPEAPRAQGERLITDKDIEDYGPDLLEVVGKRAKEEFNPVVSDLRRKVEQLEAQVRGVGTQVVMTARERLYSALDSEVPNWRVLDENQRFIDWLQLPDQYSGVIRHELLNAAYERNDAPRVLAFFKGFLAEEAAMVPAPTVEPSLSPPPTSIGAAKVPLETFAAPGRAKSTAAPAPVEKPVIHRAQITQFYADVARGKYAGREAEKNRLDQMIFEAERDGRIR